MFRTVDLFPRAAAVVLPAASLLLLSNSAHADSVVAYYEDFDDVAVNSRPAEFSGGGAARGVQDYAGIGTGADTFSGNFLRNGAAGQPQPATVLTLTNLAAHTSVDLVFLLAVIDSWDGSTGGASPDTFNVEVDGTLVFSRTFDQYVSSDQGYVPPAGGQLTTRNADGTFDNLWDGVSATQIHGDSAYDMGLDPVFKNIAHTSSTLSVRFYASGAGWQGSPNTNVDESWAIDNVGVVLNGVAAVPLPGAGSMGLGLLGALAMKRRRRTA